MSKFSKQKTTSMRAPVRSTGRQTQTFEGGDAFERDAKSDLFLLAVTNMVGEDTFYEDAATRDDRYTRLIHAVTEQDPDWVARFLPWLRQTANMRSASIVGAAEYIRAGGPNGRSVVKSVLQRPDEPGEILGYWMQAHGRNLPMPLKRGVADAITERLFNEVQALRYDGNAQGFRFGDVIDLVHPRPKNSAQSDLFRALLDRRHGRDDTYPNTLPVLHADMYLQAIEEPYRRKFLRTPRGKEMFETARWSWERLSGWLPGGMDAEAWEFVIPQMGYMALLRNLRNFEQAGVSRDTLKAIRYRLEDPDEVAKSKQFPYRFLSAYKATESLTFATSLEEALRLACSNIPEFTGSTLALIDVSGSMDAPISNRSKVARWEVGALFACALALKGAEVDIAAFGTTSESVPILKSASVLRSMEKVHAVSQRVGWGTNIWHAINDHFNGHDRIVIFTDDQAHDSGGFKGTPPFFHIFNLAGYAPSLADVGKNKTFEYGGFTDASFRLMNILETVGHGDWPF